MVCHMLATMQMMVETEKLKPLVPSGIPLCSAQYERLFATTRIPGLEAGTCIYMYIRPIADGPVGWFQPDYFSGK